MPNIVHAHEGKVAAINVVQVTEVTSCDAMEKEGFERCIQDLAREEVTVKRIATDCILS